MTTGGETAVGQAAPLANCALERSLERWPRRTIASITVLTLVVYALMAEASYVFVIPPNRSAVFWLPSGLTFALLVRARRLPALWPGYGGALFLGELVATGRHGPFAVALAWSLANVALGVGIVGLARRFVVGPFAFRNLRDVGVLAGITFVAVVPGSLLAAAAGVVGLGLPSFVDATVSWAVSDALGILLLAPVLLSWSSRHPKTVGRWPEAVALGLALTTSAAIVYLRAEATRLERSLPSLLLLYVAWGSIRFGPRMTTMAILVVDLIAVMATARGCGPLTMSGLSPAAQLLNIQVLLASSGVVMLLLAAAIEQQRALRAAAENMHEFMIQTEKIVSLGGLAAGTAHEINNPLGIISQSAQNIERRFDPTLAANLQVANEIGLDLDLVQAYIRKREIHKFHGAIRMAVGRATKIVSNMLQFSRRPDSQFAPTSLAMIVDDAIELAANDYDLRKRYDFRNIAIVRDYESRVPDVPVVRIEIEQVVLNLLKNAAQALLERTPVGEPRIGIHVGREGRFAVLTVDDNGPGMSESVRSRVFEPFFTTKKPGSGTGLGMSVAYAIVTKNHRGVLSVDSDVGAGARFIVKLPLTPEHTYA